MIPRPPEEPSLGGGLLVSLLVHLGLAAGLWGLAQGTGGPPTPTGVLTVRLTTLGGGGAGGGPGGPAARESAPARREPAPARPRVEAEPEPPAEEKPQVQAPPPVEEAPDPKPPEKPAVEREEPSVPVPETAPQTEAEAEPPGKAPQRATAVARAKDRSPRPAEKSTRPEKTTVAPASPVPVPVSMVPPQDGPGGSQAEGAGPGDGSGPGTGSGSGGVILDSPFPYPWYLRIIQRRVSGNWLKPASTAGVRRGAVVYFRVLRDGRLGVVEIERSSGLELFDRSALRAIHSMGRLPPLPGGFEEEYLGVHFEFLP